MNNSEFFDSSMMKSQHGGGGAENVLVHYAHSRNDAQVVSPDPTLKPREFAGFSRIHHQGATTGDNKSFYDEVLKKIIPSALAGQSFTILFCGAPASGRSQTMYTIDTTKNMGSITYGMVHYIAQDLLSSGPNVRVFVNAYNARGSRCFDSRTDRVAPIRSYQSPLGPTPEVSSILLEKPEDAMIVPLNKRPDQTNFITFEIFHQHGSAAATAPPPPPQAPSSSTLSSNGFDHHHHHQQHHNPDAAAAATAAASRSSSPLPPTANSSSLLDRKGAFSLITLVDVAQFDNPLPDDVIALRSSVSRQIAGSDPHWESCRLTELLEYSFCRGRTVIGIGTVVGQPSSIFEKTCSVLDFVALLGRIEQVASIAQFQHPKWLPELPARISNLDRQHDERWRRNYERGVFEVYRKMQEALAAKLQEVGKLMEEHSEPSERLVELRRSLRDRLEQALRQIQSSADNEVSRIDKNLALAAQKKKDLDKEQAELDHATNLLNAKRTGIAAKKESLEVQQDTVNDGLAAIEFENRLNEKRFAQHQLAKDAAHGQFLEAKKNCVRIQDQIRRHWTRKAAESALEKLQTAKEALKAQLAEATAKAVNQDNLQRQERQQQRKTGGNTLSQQQQQHVTTATSTTAIITTTSSSSRPGSTQQQHSSQQHQQSQQQQQRMSGSRRDRSVDSVCSRQSNNSNCSGNNNTNNNANFNNQQHQNIAPSNVAIAPVIVNRFSSSQQQVPLAAPSSSTGKNTRSSLAPISSQNQHQQQQSQEVDEDGSPEFTCQMRRKESQPAMLNRSGVTSTALNRTTNENVTENRSLDLEKS